MTLTQVCASNLLNFNQVTATAQDEACTLTRFTTWGFAAFQLTGTWAGTVTFEASVDSANWVTVSVTPSNSATTVTTATGNGVWWVENTGYAAFRARFSTATSGTVKMTIKYLASQF